MLDCVKAQLTVALDQTGQIRSDELTKRSRAHKRTLVETVICTQSETVKPTEAFLPRGFLQGFIDSLVCFRFQFFWLIVHAERKFHHRISIWDTKGHIAVLYQKVTVTGLFADDLNEPCALVEIARVGMDKDGAVLVAFRGGNEQISHVVSVKMAFFFLHLQPLTVIAMQRVDPAKGLHGEVENQLEVRDATGERPSFEGGNETFTRRIHAFFKWSKACSKKSGLPKLPDFRTSILGGAFSDTQDGRPG
jgi:hypothetical protein